MVPCGADGNCACSGRMGITIVLCTIDQKRPFVPSPPYSTKQRVDHIATNDTQLLNIPLVDPVWCDHDRAIAGRARWESFVVRCRLGDDAPPGRGTQYDTTPHRLAADEHRSVSPCQPEALATAE
jgi:hypothetical protein